ncbi:hypothetical protein AVDCRST_MAG92-3502 [uncultured Coleofasciculus sp.]|uniref:Uncharacterized protein n=1 Tax=uncultured Coleofasciculus sp. TaxID=1267456 RepID=A0A6J4JIW7_9CYAN|nr:hypothetical protein AVDCRST_MAG92-3502 [uncultured Coleofasciculus sp.]
MTSWRTILIIAKIVVDNLLWAMRLEKKALSTNLKELTQA